MDCLHPVSIPNPSSDYEFVKRNPTILVPCGKCESCVISSAQEWRVRLQIEAESSVSAFFLTLTYRDDALSYSKLSDSCGNSYIVPVVCKRDCQLYLKRVRKRFCDSKIRFYLVSEYGPSTLRPHYHCIIFGIPPKYKDSTKARIYVANELEKLWTLGNVRVDPVTDGRIAYVTKYISCITYLPEYYPKPFRLMSRRPGIGASYLDRSDRIDWHRCKLANFIPFGSHKNKMPRYLKNKIFDDAMLADIKDNVNNFRSHKLDCDIKLAYDLGYSNYVDFRQSSIERQARKFSKLYVKSRDKT